jgi:hypothetical protein
MREGLFSEPGRRAGAGKAARRLVLRGWRDKGWGGESIRLLFHRNNSQGREGKEGAQKGALALNDRGLLLPCAFFSQVSFTFGLGAWPWPWS